MDDNTITALAREYAEEVYKDIEDERIRKPMVDSLAKGTEDSFRFLLRRYALVDKEAVCKEYHEIKLALGDGGRSEWEDDINMGKEALLKSLFPEIAKEVES